MEPTVRFELTTYCLQNNCSDQLSYVGENINIISPKDYTKQENIVKDNINNEDINLIPSLQSLITSFTPGDPGGSSQFLSSERNNFEVPM